VEAGVQLLSSAEVSRAASFVAPVDQARFVVGRAVLRGLLGRLTGVAPAALRLQLAVGGKPALSGSPLRFSTSKSASRMLIATSWTLEVGVDLEAIRPDVAMEAVAARFFAPAEQAALASMGPEARHRAAYQCWSCKEAYLKGTGTGLPGPAGSVVTWVPGAASTTVGEWRVHPIDLGDEFAAAVAGRSSGPWRLGPPRPL